MSKHNKVKAIFMIIVIHTLILGVVIHWYKSIENQIDYGHETDKKVIQTKITVGGQELVLDAYYSEKEQTWCFTLPAMYENSKLNVEFKENQELLISYERKSGENLILVEHDGEMIPIKFLCADNIGTIFVDLKGNYTLADIHADKEAEIAGCMLCLDSEGTELYLPMRFFSGHGNDSWEAPKKSYDVKLDSEVNLFEMGGNNDYVLLAGYRDNSLMSFCITTEMVQELDFRFAPEFRVVNLFVEGKYLGIYFLTEKIELDQNRIDIRNLYRETKALNGEYTLENSELERKMYDNSIAKRFYYHLSKNPEDISGGYLLEMDINNHDDFSSRFISERNNRMVLKRAKYSSKEQMNYIANYWQEFENALYSETGYNDKGKYYAEYIDLESFAMQWLIYELLQETSMHSSIYYYKESNISGDGLLHACYPWDMEHSYLMNENINDLWNVEVKEGYWNMYYQHKDFRDAVSKIWKERFVPVIEQMIEKEIVWEKNGFKNISGYQKEYSTVYQLDSARWSEVDSMEKCESIRKFLKIRLNVLNEVFN